MLADYQTLSIKLELNLKQFQAGSFDYCQTNYVYLLIFETLAGGIK